MHFFRFNLMSHILKRYKYILFVKMRARLKYKNSTIATGMKHLLNETID